MLIYFYVSWLVNQLILWHHSAASTSAFHEQLLLQMYKAQRHAVTLKIPYLSRIINCSRHADLFIYLFLKAVRSEVPPSKVWKFQHNFLIDYWRDFSLILDVCTRPQVDSLVWVSGMDLSLLFFMNFEKQFLMH